MRTDPFCYEVADKFLSKVKGADEMDKTELAEAIQELCEEFVRGIKEDESTRP